MIKREDVKGGVALSQGNPSCLRFSLEESVWFQKGQEVSELISISLDPNITIQESDQYVTIQGALELAGEYKRSEAEAADGDEVAAGAKFVQEVEEREEGTCEFKHYFPVDITIPNNRIQSIYDIDVAVESFDYVLPERSCMKLTANLTITGLYGEQQHIPVQEWQEEVEVEELEPLQRASAVDEVEEEAVIEKEWSVYQEEDQEEERTEPVYDSAEEENQVAKQDEDQSEPEEVFVPFEAEARKQPVQEEQQVKEPEAPAALEGKQEKNEEQPAESTPEISFASQRSEEAPPSAQEIYEMTEASESDSPSYEKKPKEVEAEESPEEEESSSSSEQEAKKKKFSKKKSMSLTEFFARKEEEEEHVKLKVCIVQNGDTIDAIAERYDIPAQQLLRVNHLEINQDIYEGQVLYIPVAVAH